MIPKKIELLSNNLIVALDLIKGWINEPEIVTQESKDGQLLLLDIMATGVMHLAEMAALSIEIESLDAASLKGYLLDNAGVIDQASDFVRLIKEASFDL